MFRTLSRLRGRSREELADRAAQFLIARAERWGLRDSRELTSTELTRRLDPSAFGGRATLHEWFARHQCGEGVPFLPGLADRDKTVSSLRHLVPGAEAEVVARAERMLRGEFDLLGHRGLKYELPIDWQLDPISGKRAPQVHWSQIRFLDPLVAGDHKAIWELNRHQVLVTLGQAYWYTADERFAERAAGWFTEWMDANPPKRGINWASSLEVAYRANSWLWALQLMRHSPHLTEALFIRVTGHLTISARHLERFLSTYFSPNTHLTGEALGLYVLGVQLAPFSDARRWRERGLRILLEQLPKHVMPDGIYFEQATYYQRYTAEFYLYLLILAGAAGTAEADQVRQPVIALMESLQSMMRPDGTIPLIGDDDGGRLLFLDSAGGNDIRGLLSVAAAHLGRGDFGHGANGPRPELIWLLGPEGAKRWHSLRIAPPALASRAFMHGGIIVMRDSWSRHASVMVIDGGPHGVFNCGHAHADALSFDLTVEGQPLFVDPGTFTYTGSQKERDYFRSTAVHNTVSLNAQSSSISDGPFSWTTIANSSIERWHASPRVDYFEGAHDGYERPAVHAELMRAVVYVKDGYWVVRDRVITGKRFEALANFQCAVGLSASTISSGVIAVRDAGGEIVRVHATGPGVIAEVDEGWVSPTYGVKHRAPRVRVHVVGTGTTAFATMIALTRLDARVSEKRGPSSDIVEVMHGRYRDSIAFADGGTHPETEGVGTDADMFWIRRDTATGAPLEFFATGATQVYIDRELVATMPNPGAIAATRGADGWVMQSVGASAPAMPMQSLGHVSENGMPMASQSSSPYSTT